MQNLKQAIRNYIAKNILFSGESFPYPDDASFINEGIISSINVLELVMFAEQEFDIAVDDAELVPDNFDSVSGLANYIQGKRLAVNPAG